MLNGTCSPWDQGGRGWTVLGEHSKQRAERAHHATQAKTGILIWPYRDFDTDQSTLDKTCKWCGTCAHFVPVSNRDFDRGVSIHKTPLSAQSWKSLCYDSLVFALAARSKKRCAKWPYKARFGGFTDQGLTPGIFKAQKGFWMRALIPVISMHFMQDIPQK